MQSFQRKGGREVGSKECEANLVLQNVERTFYWAQRVSRVLHGTRTPFGAYPVADVD